MSNTVCCIGTGANPDEPGREGYAMAYRHAAGYERLEDCELVGCADIVRENAERFAAEFDIDPENVYEDYEAMLREVRPEIVSVCVPPAVHAEIVVGCARSGVVEAIHCEKPMATTWGECREMNSVCEDHDVQLTINHQRRFGRPFREAKRLLDSGAIGDLVRCEFAAENLYDVGTHYFDLCNYYAGGARAEWVLAGLDYRERNVWFGVHNENQALVQWRYENGVSGLASTGYGAGFVGCQLRLVGEDGAIEIDAEDGSALRLRRGGSGWKEIDTNGETVHGPSFDRMRAAARKVAGLFSDRLAEAFTPTPYVDRAIEEVVSALRTGRDSELAATNALRATELIFASWESVRRSGRVDLPLRIEDNPLDAMVQSGRLAIGPAEETEGLLS